MAIQYARFVSLVLGPQILGGTPIWPFDPSTGSGVNMQFHYYPDGTIQLHEGELGYAIAHYQDDDSRIVCAFVCDDSFLTENPDFLTDMVDQGLGAWGGVAMTPSEALSLVQTLQPARSIEIPDPDNPGETITKNFGPVSLTVDNIMTRSVTQGSSSSSSSATV